MRGASRLLVILSNALVGVACSTSPSLDEPRPAPGSGGGSPSPEPPLAELCASTCATQWRLGEGYELPETCEASCLERAEEVGPCAAEAEAYLRCWATYWAAAEEGKPGPDCSAEWDAEAKCRWENGLDCVSSCLEGETGGYRFDRQCGDGPARAAECQSTVSGALCLCMENGELAGQCTSDEAPACGSEHPYACCAQYFGAPS